MAGAHLMLAAELIRAVEQAGGRLEPDGDALVVEAPMPLPEPIMIELRAHKTEVLDFLTRPVARVVLLHCPPGVPEAWVQGVADLLVMAPPVSCPPERWQALRDDAYTFLRHHAARAHGLGWSPLDLFGVHSVKPWARLDVMGLVPLLRGREVAALNRDRATIKMIGDQVLTCRRVQATCPTDACLVWDLR